MKLMIVMLLTIALCGVAYAEKFDPGPQDPVYLDLLDCDGATQMTCGETAANADPGMGGTVATYSCSGLNYGQCGEVVYEICLGEPGTLQVDMTYNHTADNDLDLFLLGSCEEADCLDASTGVSGTESVSADLPAGTYYAVVDGWADNCDGTAGHDIAVICDAPCTVSSEASTWSEIKRIYR